MLSDDEAVDRRALALFERLSDEEEERRTLLADEPAAVLARLANLEAAAVRARSTFPTEEDARSRSRPRPLPDRVGHYRLGDLIGEGGMGLVFAAARDDGLFEHDVAVKLIHPHWYSEAAAARFESERAILARLDHPCIARLIDGGVTADGWPYIIMERIDGLPLCEFVEREHLASRARVVLLMQICSAVQAAHAALVVHGDIKPDNVLVRADATPRLLDFGVARLVDEGGPIALAPRTAAFCAPERLSGGPPTVAGDIFALGMTARAIVGHGGPLPADRSVTDPDLTAVIERATAPDAPHRYASVEAMRLDLGRWLDGLPVSAKAQTLPYQLKCFVRRHLIGTLMIAALLLGLVVALAWAGVAWQRARLRASELTKLADYQLIEIDRKLDALPRTVMLRAEMATEVQSYLDRLAAGGDNTPALRLHAADGLRRLALLQGAMDRPSLGRTFMAQQTFQRALAMVPTTSDEVGAQLRARIFVDAARVANGSADPARADRLLRAADLRQAGSDVRAAWLIERSAVEQWNGRFPAAMRAARSARAKLGNSASGLEAAMIRIESYDLEAEAAYYASDLATARRLYVQAERLAELAANRWPNERRVRWKLAHERWALGTTLTETRDFSLAVPLLRSAEASASRDAAIDPADTAIQRANRVYMLALGEALVGAGDPGEGVPLLRRSLALRHAAWQADIHGTALQRDWLVGLNTLSDALAKSGRTDEACSVRDAASRTISTLVRKKQLSPLDVIEQTKQHAHYEALCRRRA